MKNVYIFCIVVLLFGVSLSFAQMGKEMMGGQKGMSGSMMEGQQGQMGQGQMMQGMMGRDQMMGSMMNMTHQMQGMMGDMSEMMKDMPMSDEREMSDIMKDMSQRMMEMSTMMHRGTASEKEMKEAEMRRWKHHRCRNSMCCRSSLKN